MEGFNGGLKGYWKRQDYERLDGSEGGGGRRHWRKNQRRVALARAGGGQRRRRFWRIKVTPRLGFLRQFISPRRFFARIRDAYVRMMLRFANSGVLGGGYDFGYGADLGAGFGRAPLKEYDEKMIVEIYKSLMAQGQQLLTTTTAQIVPPR